MESIINEFLETFQIDKKLFYDSQIAEYASLRHIFAVAMYENGYSQQDIKRYLRKKDHTTIIRSIDTGRSLLARTKNDMYKKAYNTVYNMIADRYVIKE